MGHEYQWLARMVEGGIQQERWSCSCGAKGRWLRSRGLVGSVDLWQRHVDRAFRVKPVIEQPRLDYHDYIWHSDTETLLRASECITLTLTDEEAFLLATKQCGVDKLIQRRTGKAS